MFPFLIHVSARPIVTQPVEEKHALFLAGIKGMTGPWAMPGIQDTVMSVKPGELSAYKSLTRQFRFRNRSFLKYAFRNEADLIDSPSRDDIFCVDFNDKKCDYQDLAMKVLPTFIYAMDAYRGCLSQDDFWMQSAAESQRLYFASGEAYARRGEILHIHPINFWDAEQAMRGLKKTPEEIVQKLEGVVEHVALMKNGVYVVCFDHFPAMEEIVAMDEKVKQALAR